jgi:mono/diheme cytochrome c family protein
VHRYSDFRNDWRSHDDRHAVAIAALVLPLGLASTIALQAGSPTSPAAATAADAVRIARGEYLVRFGSCHDCHTPHKLGPRGPEPDLTRALSGHPSNVVLPPAPKLAPGPWVMIGAGTNTAFAGPWGVSFTANLTPDVETGLGQWTEDMFITALRTGRHEGKGRPILPPMPYPWISTLNDDDLKAVFAYLRSLPPVRNRVPAPIDPEEEVGR